MKLRNAMIGFLLAMAAGCDTMEQDLDGQVLSINNDPAYFLPNSDGIIDLPSRIISPGKVRVEITTTTRNGVLKDLGKGLLQYTPQAGSSKDSFWFRVFSDDNRVLGEDSIGIIIPSDTTTLPCKWVFAKNDTARNVSGPVTVDVVANDYSCSGTLTISVNMQPEHGTAVVVGNKIQYIPNSTFTGRDKILYKATSSDPALVEGYAFLHIYGETNCWTRPKNDLFFKPVNDSSLMYLDVLANDSICNDSTIAFTQLPKHGTATIYNNLRKIAYKNPLASNLDDTLMYTVGGTGNGVARVIIKRQ